MHVNEEKSKLIEHVNALMLGVITPTQLEVLEMIISRSKKMTTRTKKTILWLLRQTHYMSRDVAMTIHYKKENEDKTPAAKFALEVANGVHSFSNEIYAAMKLIGIKKHISFHCGVASKAGKNLIKYNTGYDSRKQKLIPMEIYGYTIWISSEPYQNNVALLAFNPAKIKKSKLRRYYSELFSSKDNSSGLNREFEEDSEVIPEEEKK